MVVKVVDNCEGRLGLDGLVANGDRRSIGSVDNDFDNVQCGNMLGKILHPTLDIE